MDSSLEVEVYDWVYPLCGLEPLSAVFAYLFRDFRMIEAVYCNAKRD